MGTKLLRNRQLQQTLFILVLLYLAGQLVFLYGVMRERTRRICPDVDTLQRLSSSLDLYQKICVEYPKQELDKMRDLAVSTKGELTRMENAYWKLKQTCSPVTSTDGSQNSTN